MDRATALVDESLRTAEESREMAVSALEKQEQNRQKQLQIREACEELDVSGHCCGYCVGIVWVLCGYCVGIVWVLCGYYVRFDSGENNPLMSITINQVCYLCV